MTDFFNSKVEGSVVCDVRMSSPKKSKATVAPLQGHTWKVHAKSRGKETKLIFESGLERRELLIHFFKGGVWEWYSSAEATRENSDYERDHRFSLVMDDGSIISQQDQFHQSFWKWSDKWGLYKSPDIVLEHNAWRKHLYEHRNNRHFFRPIYEVMMHPWFFNGINNFTRSEILARTKFSPFTTGSEIFASEALREDFFETTLEVLQEIYRMGGMQLGRWKNPFEVDPSELKKWIQVYNRDGQLKLWDGKRTFYFHRRWKTEWEYLRLKKMSTEEDLEGGTGAQA